MELEWGTRHRQNAVEDNLLGLYRFIGGEFISAGKQTPLHALTEKYSKVFHEGYCFDMERLLDLSKERTLYCFLIMPRSGSTWLCELMMGTNALGMPNEWLNPDFIVRESVSELGCAPPKFRGTADINKYFSHIAEEGKGAAGIQLSYWQCMALRPLLNGQLPTGKIHWFYLRRRNILEQTISFYKSITTGIWHSFQLHKTSETPLGFDKEKGVNTLAKLVLMEQRFEALMAECGIDPMRLFYEDIKADPLSALQIIAAKLDCPSPDSIPSGELRILRDHNTIAWEKELNEDLRVSEILKLRPN